MNQHGTQLSTREPNYPRYPNVKGAEGSWWTTHRNWHISTGDEDFVHPMGTIICQHDADDKPHRTFRAQTLADAVMTIDAMPNYGDLPGDYD